LRGDSVRSRQVWVLVLFLSASSQLLAQLANTTSLVGSVKDTAGAEVPDAKVTAVNTATSDTYTTVTNSAGSYRIDFVKIGTYNISVQHEGFAALNTSGVLVQSNETVRTDFVLKIGQ